MSRSNGARRVRWGALAGLLVLGACSAPEPRPDAPPADAPSVRREDPSPRTPSAAKPVASGDAVAPKRLPAGTLARLDVEAAIAKGPGWLLNRLPLEPVVSAGRRFLGFRLVAIFDDSPRAHSFGVRPGDIVQTVNDVRLIRPEDLMRILAGVRGADAIVVRLLRDGEPKTVRIPIADDPDLGEPAAKRP